MKLPESKKHPGSLRFGGGSDGSDLPDLPADQGQNPTRRGLTLEQWWSLNQQVFGESCLCLINRLQPPQPADRITPKKLLTGEEIVKIVSGLKADTLVPAIVYDGDLVIHAVALEGLDASGRMTYWDPSPGRSLLCAENNAAGVAAMPGPNGLWLISRDELEVVILAALVEANDGLGV